MNFLIYFFDFLTPGDPENPLSPGPLLAPKYHRAWGRTNPVLLPSRSFRGWAQFHQSSSHPKWGGVGASTSAPSRTQGGELGGENTVLLVVVVVVCFVYAYVMDIYYFYNIPKGGGVDPPTQTTTATRVKKTKPARNSWAILSAKTILSRLRQLWCFQGIAFCRCCLFWCDCFPQARISAMVFRNM